MLYQSKFYRLIVDSEYRIWRHFLFIFILGIITFNQVFISYQDSATYLGGKLYLICLISFATYLITTYVNYFLFIPKLLLKEHYITYIVLLVSVVILLIFTSIFLEYAIRTFLALPHRIKSYTNPLIMVDSLSSSMITMICFWSMSAVTLFRKWNTMSDHIITLEHRFLESEVNKLKGQVSPIFLSKALQKASSLTKTNAPVASTILLQLGQLLRYQLYDCDREKVFLKSEITFINNFLQLYKLIRNHDFQYEIAVKGKSSNLMISPLLLLVLVQTILANDDVINLDIAIETIAKQIQFDCHFRDDYALAEESTKEVSDKLNTLYPNAYTWNSAPGNIQLHLDVA